MSEIICCSGAARISLIFSWVMPAVGERGTESAFPGREPMGEGSEGRGGRNDSSFLGSAVKWVDRRAQRSFLPGPVKMNTTCWAMKKSLESSWHCININDCYVHSSSTWQSRPPTYPPPAAQIPGSSHPLGPAWITSSAGLPCLLYLTRSLFISSTSSRAVFAAPGTRHAQ